MADTEFPLPGSSYKELIKIIQGYGRIGGDAGLTDVARMTAMPETGISANNKFLVAIGVVKGGKKKAITPLGAELANALEHQQDLPEEAAVKWRAVVDSNDFLQKIIAAVRIRKGMDESSLESHVAYSAGQPKTPAVATGARTVVDILKAAGLVKEEGGSLIPITPEPRPISETVEKTLSLSDSMTMSDSTPFVQGSFSRSTHVGGVQLNIDVTVQCTPDDLETLGHKLRKVLQDFNQTTELGKKPETPSSTAPAEDDEAAG